MTKFVSMVAWPLLWEKLSGNLWIVQSHTSEPMNQQGSYNERLRTAKSGSATTIGVGENRESLEKRAIALRQIIEVPRLIDQLSQRQSRKYVERTCRENEDALAYIESIQESVPYLCRIASSCPFSGNWDCSRATALERRR